MSRVAEPYGKAIGHERDHALGFFHGEVQAEASVEIEMNAAPVEGRGLEERDGPAPHDDIVVLKGADELDGAHRDTPGADRKPVSMTIR